MSIARHSRQGVTSVALRDEHLDPTGAARLYSVARALTSAVTVADVIAAVFDRLAGWGASTAGLWLLDGGTIRYTAGSGIADRVPAALTSIALDDAVPVADCIRSGQVVLFGSGAERDQRWPKLAGVTKAAEATAVLPLIASGRILGGLHIGYPATMAPDDFDVAFLGGLAELGAAALDRAQMHEAERERESVLLDTAHVLQRLLLPDRLPVVAGLDVAARYLTARPEADAGGDFYDLVRLPSDRVGFVIGDVEGHDPVAAAIMGQLRSALRALAGQHREPDLLIDALRWSWDLLGFSRMATCLVGRLDPADGSLTMCSAGHLPPVRVGPAGAELLSIPASPPLGATAGPATATLAKLAAGTTLFLYTDGLVEARRRGIDSQLGRLQRVLCASATAPVDEMCERVLSEMVGTGDQPDDVAVMALRWTGPGAADG